MIRLVSFTHSPIPLVAAPVTELPILVAALMLRGTHSTPALPVTRRLHLRMEPSFSRQTAPAQARGPQRIEMATRSQRTAPHSLILSVSPRSPSAAVRPVRRFSPTQLPRELLLP